jgi:hypothetical protein
MSGVITPLRHFIQDAALRLSVDARGGFILRVFADYRPSVDVEGRDAREAISIMNTIFDSF